MSVLIRPVNTEKANEGSELKNCYTFEVAKDANKIQKQKRRPVLQQLYRRR